MEQIPELNSLASENPPEKNDLDLSAEILKRFNSFAQEKRKRIEERVEEWKKSKPHNFVNGSDPLYDASIEIEERLNINTGDDELMERQKLLISQRSPDHNSIKNATELDKEIRKELAQLDRKRAKNFVDNNPDMFFGIPSEIIDEVVNRSDEENTGFKNLGYLLGLPYHLKKMREDGITCIVASASSSIPYSIILKKIDELLYPDSEKIKFLIYSTKTKGIEVNKQNQKLVEYFGKYPDAKIGAFDECASSNEHVRWHYRPTVTRIKKEIENLLPTKIVERYGTDALYPSFPRGSKCTLGTSGYGDEGKAGYLTWMSNTIEEDQVDDGKKLNLYRSDYKGEYTDQKGYKRTEHGQSGLRSIEKLERFAQITCNNYIHNTDSVWNPFNDNIRAFVDHYYRNDPSDFE